ncbi:hypothetical protein D3C78_1852940 [compost metagenome]
MKQDGDWFAYDELPMPALPEEVSQPELYLEGAVREVTVTRAIQRSSVESGISLDGIESITQAKIP